MNLVISTTKWWGNHPSVVFYFDGPVNFSYNQDDFTKQIISGKSGTCFALYEDDKKSKIATLLKNKDNESFSGLLLFEIE